MGIEELYASIMERHILIGDKLADLVKLQIEQGVDLAAFSVLIERREDVEPSSETEPCPPPNCPCAVDCILVENHDGPCVDGSGSDIATAPIGSAPEMAVYAPSTVPPTVDPIEPESTHVDTPAPEQSAPVKSARVKNEYTAKQWAESAHFLAYVKKTSRSSRGRLSSKTRNETRSWRSRIQRRA